IAGVYGGPKKNVFGLMPHPERMSEDLIGGADGKALFARVLSQSSSPRAPPVVVDLLYFVLLISILIFIHESGHFAFAKIFGVKVITFSIGFGPQIFRIRGKETEYCIALFPLGGFVKMLEEAKGTEPILPEDK